LPWTLLPSTTPIQPLVLGEAAAAVALSRALWDRGIFVPAIRPPTVPQGTARLRVSFSAAHTDDDVDALLAALAEAA
jgi:8-amino-7-oxononanoate synthase